MSGLKKSETAFWCDWTNLKGETREEIDKIVTKLYLNNNKYRTEIENLINTNYEFLESKIYNEIFSFLSIKKNYKNKLILNFIENNKISNEGKYEVMDRIIHYIDRFMTVTGLNDNNINNKIIENNLNNNENQINLDNNTLISPIMVEWDNPEQIINYYIFEVYYLRWSPIKFKYNYPYAVSDMLGLLTNNMWFYYKDGHPFIFDKDITHRKWIFLVGETLNDLLMQMDKNDINLFLNNVQNYRILVDRRCGCELCDTFEANQNKEKIDKKKIKVVNNKNENNNKNNINGGKIINQETPIKSLNDTHMYQSYSSNVVGNDLSESLMRGHLKKKTSINKNNSCCKCIIL